MGMSREYWVMVIAHGRRAYVQDLQTLEVKAANLSAPLKEAWEIVKKEGGK